VRVPRHVWITGRGAELELAGGVELDKDPYQPPHYTGELGVVRGIYQLRARTFDVGRGRIVFSGESRLDPTLEIAGRTEIRDTRITARITGRLSEPRVTLSSEPALPQSEILSLLAFGRRSGQLEQGEAAGLTSMLAEAGGQLALDQLRALLGERRPVDTADFRLQERGEGAQLRVGKYVGEDVFVRYGRTFGHSRNDVEVEWRLAPSVSVESQVSSGGSAGADLLWRRDY
jgi:translocation and assembly module TamB